MSLPDYDPRGNKDVGDILEPTYPGSLEELMEVFVDWVRWHRQREPVNPGDPFTKFATRGWLVQQGVVTEAQVLGDDTTTDADDEAGAVEDRMVVVYAREMHPATTAGCSALTILELSSTKPTIATLNFDATTQEYAHVALLMPPGWPGGSFTYRVYWSHTSGGSGFGVAWNLAGNSCENDETISAVFDSGTTVTDTGGTADDMYITDESAATPIQGTLAKAGDLVFLRLSRVPSHASDTLNIDARLHAIRFNLSEAQVEDQPDTPTDPYFSSVVLLLHCNGADGATSVPDSSTFARTGTGNSTIALSTTRSKFGSASLKVTRRDPGGLTFGSHADFSRTNNQAWTMECWVYVVNSENFTSAPVLIYWVDNNSVADSFSVYSTTPQLDISTSGTGEPTQTTISKNVWIHVASTFDGTNETFWIDGVSIGSFARSIGASASGTIYVGGFTGSGAADTTEVYIDEVRVTLGVARYTATFTPPTAAFPDS